ncbi:hypothetical protein O181_045127 [Austropuccinia psidii MF-1]|uniref:Uncharacterized protein n=1 Tax=Austropuccinia psidii MF-1 TaxID=1389203 RepID=A0A9Q3DT77_9BASI|nr:hypothetical protein [Austropuccinia psidii MF-1]
MDWQRCFYNGNLQSYIDTCRKLLLELNSFSIEISNELLSYSLLGKLAGDTKLHQFSEVLSLKEEHIEKPELILTCLQDYIHISNPKHTQPTTNPSALISSTDKPYRVIYYCTNGKHDKKSTSHKKEQCWTENTHLRWTIKDKKQTRFHSKAYLSIYKALKTSSKPPIRNQLD